MCRNLFNISIDLQLYLSFQKQGMDELDYNVALQDTEMKMQWKC